MKQLRFSILHPTARVKPYPPSLPRGWQHVCEAMRESCVDPDSCEYIVVVHESRWQEFRNGPLGDPVRFLRRLWKNYRFILNLSRDCNVDQVNRAAIEASGEILIGVMDDLFPCVDWDRFVYGAFPDPSAPAVLHFGTGSPRDKDLIVGGAMTKAYFDKVGYIHPPEFESMYADDYMTRKWRSEGVVIERLDIQFEHRHPVFGKAAMDPIYALQNRPEAYRQGRKELQRRISNESVEKPSSGWPWRVISCLLPGETFSYDYIVAWTNIYGRLLQQFEVHPHFGHTSNVYVTRLELTQSVLDVEPHGEVILWIDDDNIVNWDQVNMLLTDLAQHPEWDAVCGWCWIYNHNTDKWLTSCGRSPSDESMMYAPLTRSEALSGQFFEHMRGGFPVVVMRREMLAKLGPRAFVPMVDEKLLYGFSSEDAAFWQRASDAGFNLACDTRVRVHHMKLRAIEPVFVADNESLVCGACGAAGGEHLPACQFYAPLEMAQAAD